MLFFRFVVYQLLVEYPFVYFSCRSVKRLSFFAVESDLEGHDECALPLDSESTLFLPNFTATSCCAPESALQIAIQL